MIYMLDKMVGKIMYWLKPGVGIKRWCVLLGSGVLFLSVAIAIVMVRYYYTSLMVSNGYLGVGSVWATVTLLIHTY